jgi:hypothetical protein
MTRQLLQLTRSCSEVQLAAPRGLHAGDTAHHALSE